MKAITNVHCVLFLLFFFANQATAQDQRDYNQNSARSNHARTGIATGVDLFLSPVYSTALRSNNDSLLFRGNGGGLKIGGNYFFGKAGIGFVSGFGSSTPDDNAINHFLQRANIPPDQIVITKSNQQNMYLLLGPMVRFGNKVELSAHAKGGLFINNGGMINIQQKGAVRAAYRNESTTKSIYPGFQTGLNVQYNSKSDIWSFGIGADYMGTKTEVNNYDMRRGNGIEGLKFSKNISDIVAGITIRYNIGSSRDQSSGLATGRLLPTVNKKEITAPREAQTGLATGRRVLPTVNKREIAIDEQGVHKTATQSCGPVTIKTTNADGSTTERTFACVDDAAAYERQTPKKDFGEKMSTGQPSIIDNKKTMDGSGIISGRVTWSSNTGTGIITNKMMVAGTTSMQGPGGSAKGNTGNIKGTATIMYAREVQTGRATGKMYQPMFADGQTTICDSCLAEIKSNPLYSQSGVSGNNPLYENKNNQRTNGGDEDCDGVAGLDVFLLDINSKQAIAKTTTESCGDFWFANVPYGEYIVKITGSVGAKKGYDIYIKNKTDLAGQVTAAEDYWTVRINTGSNDNAKTAINNSHSNIKNLVVIEGDLDGDGEFESLRAQGIFSDGSSRDIMADARIAGGKRTIILESEAFRMRRRVEVLKSNKQSSPNTKTLNSITVSTGDVNGDGNAVAINTSHSNIKNLRVIATYSDGTTEDVTEYCAINTSHSNIKQYSIAVADLDGDGIAEAVVKTKTKSNQSNDRVATGDLNGDGVAEAIIKTKTKSNQSNDKVAAGDVNGDGADLAINNSHSNIKNLPVAAGDVNGDGVAETIVGGFLPGGAVVSAALSSGDPIHGVDVKLLSRSGGNGRSIRTNNYGEFEFTDLSPGNYNILVSHNYYINDETVISVGDELSSKVVVRGWDPGKKEMTDDKENNNLKIQNNNTVRSNRTEFAMAIIEADLDGDGEFESNYLSANGAIATISVIGPGKAKLTENTRTGVKQTMQTQVCTANNEGQTNSAGGPAKWISPETINKRVWSDPHVDQKDGSLKLGEGSFGTVYKDKWRSRDVAIKTVRCDDGSCRVITAHPSDYPDAAKISLNGLPPGSPVDNAAVWFGDDKGKMYKTTTDVNGRVNLNGLPPGVPLKMILNIAVDGNEDVLIKCSGDGNIRLSKARHDIAMNAIRNMKG